jgi:TonB family protein
MKRGVFIIALILFGMIIAPFKDYAQTQEEIKLYLGEPKVISVSSPTRIAIGNPNVADVVSATKSEITLSPKATGTTTLVFWDNFGEQSYKIRVFSEDINEVKRRVDNMLGKLNLPEVSTEAEEEEGKVLLLGRVKSAQDRERIDMVLGPLKEKTIDLIEVKEEEAVVEIDVQVLELDKDATDTLGFTWPGAVNVLETSASPGLQAAGATFGKLFTIKTLERATSAGGTVTTDPFTFKLDFLVQEGKARILSRPRLACQSGKEAELLVGGEKPIFTTTVAATTGAEGTEVEYKEYGIKLKIKPTVNEDKRIKLALNVEVSEVGTAEIIGATTAPTAKAYPLSKRSASTELFLEDGQTMAIGGLMKQKTSEDIRKVPWLGDLPVLGAAFRKKTKTEGGGTGERGNTELFIALTPRIISEGGKAIEEKIQKEIRPQVAPSAAAVTESLPGPIAGYAGIIQKRILENLTYPTSAKQAGFQGTTKLSLWLSYSGELLEVKIKSSSGYQMLDENAVSAAQGITAYPPFPPYIKEKDLWIDIPIEYRLD